MKTLFVCLVAFLFAFIIGCQENSITDPLTTEPIEKVQPGTSDTYRHGFISLESVLSDPYPVGNSFYRISGQIEFDQRIVYVDPMLPASQRYLSLHLETNADLQYFCTVCSPSELDELAGFIADVSEEFIPIGGNYVSLLEKTFTIQGREDGMVLKARFSVSNNRIELNAMWLALPNVEFEATEN